jgi:hypothetical protein
MRLSYVPPVLVPAFHAAAQQSCSALTDYTTHTHHTHHQTLGHQRHGKQQQMQSEGYQRERLLLPELTPVCLCLRWLKL